MLSKSKFIRNFCIIAHIDHGKSTLADALLEFTKTVEKRSMQDQLLDNMEIERKRGITVKNHPVCMSYSWNSKNYYLNLIDTPGHVDFSYEVSRAIAVCEGALLVVDANQGIQAQTLANLYLAMEKKIKIIPVLNKIDLQSAQTTFIMKDIVNILGCDPNDIIKISAKNRYGIEKLLEQIIVAIPHPEGDTNKPLQALIFDAIYNRFRGIEIFFRVMEGAIRKNDRLFFCTKNRKYVAEEIGFLQIKHQQQDILTAGMIGYLKGNIKKASDVLIGDTITLQKNPCKNPIAGFNKLQPMVFSSLYPIKSDETKALQTALDRLQLNDSSFVYEIERSTALGVGFKCGFLGILHMEVIKERIHEEFFIEILITAPSILLKYNDKKGNSFFIYGPTEMPSLAKKFIIEEPWVKATIITKLSFLGKVTILCLKEKRGVLLDQIHIGFDRVKLVFNLPLLEIAFDFFSKLKSVSKGYASFDYDFDFYKASRLVVVDFLLNGEKANELSVILHRNYAVAVARKLCKKLTTLLPRSLFRIAVQASIEGKIVARETIRAFSKDVTTKLHGGGDSSRKKKLLEKQKKGKERMRSHGKVGVPQEVILAFLKLS